MAIGATTVAALAANAMQSGDRGGFLAGVSNAWFGGGPVPSVLGTMGSTYHLTQQQLNLIVAALANSPTQPWSALSVAQRTATLNALFATMQANAAMRGPGAPAPTSNTTQFIFWSVDGATIEGIQGGDLVAWLGANVN